MKKIYLSARADPADPNRRVCVTVFTGGQEGRAAEEGRRRPRAGQGGGRARHLGRVGQIVLVRSVVHAVFPAGRHRQRSQRRELRRRGHRVLEPAAQQHRAERVRFRRVVAAQQGVRVQVVERVTTARVQMFTNR